jgi:hypothetical protein
VRFVDGVARRARQAWFFVELAPADAHRAGARVPDTDRSPVLVASAPRARRPGRTPPATRSGPHVHGTPIDCRRVPHPIGRRPDVPVAARALLGGPRGRSARRDGPRRDGDRGAPAALRHPGAARRRGAPVHCGALARSRTVARGSPGPRCGRFPGHRVRRARARGRAAAGDERALAAHAGRAARAPRRGRAGAALGAGTGRRGPAAVRAVRPERRGTCHATGVLARPAPRDRSRSADRPRRRHGRPSGRRPSISPRSTTVSPRTGCRTALRSVV